MNCPKCDANNDDDALFCVACGSPIEPVGAETVVAEVQPESKQSEPETRGIESKSTEPAPISGKPPAHMSDKPIADAGISDKTVRSVGLIAGAVLIVIGLVQVFTAGTSISSTSFGADFYTYAYQGIVAVSEQLASIEVTLGWAVVGIGAAIDVISLKK